MTDNIIKICYFGFYDPNYSRNRVLISGLRQNRAIVVECNSRLSGIAKYFDLLKKYWRIRKQFDVMIVGFPGQQAAIFARFLTRKPMIFDAFTSIYDSAVFDRRTTKPHSLKAKYYWLLDWLSCKLANKILLDTNAHIEYFVKTFGIDRKKFCRVFVGSDDAAVYPLLSLNKERPGLPFLVHFHGLCIPLQGIEYIIRAAKILEKEGVAFNIIGRGQTYSDMMNLIAELRVNNIKLIDHVAYEELKDYMSSADICLGIFGNTSKAQRVIPNKVYEAMAVGRPIITAESGAAKELLVNRENVLFCKIADAKDLADKILELKVNKALRETIAKNAHELFNQKLRPVILARQILDIIKEFGLSAR